PLDAGGTQAVRLLLRRPRGESRTQPVALDAALRRLHGLDRVAVDARRRLLLGYDAHRVQRHHAPRDASEQAARGPTRLTARRRSAQPGHVGGVWVRSDPE